MRSVVVYLDFTCSSCNEFVLEFVEDARGKEVMPVRCHCSTTSLKTTSHGHLFRPMLFWPGCITSLNRRKEVSYFTFSLRADSGAGFYLPICVKESGGTMGRSSTRSLDDFGAAGCFTVTMFSCERKHHKSSYWRDTAAAPALSYYAPRLHGQIVD